LIYKLRVSYGLDTYAFWLSNFEGNIELVSDGRVSTLKSHLHVKVYTIIGLHVHEKKSSCKLIWHFGWHDPSVFCVLIKNRNTLQFQFLFVVLIMERWSPLKRNKRCDSLFRMFERAAWPLKKLINYNNNWLTNLMSKMFFYYLLIFIFSIVTVLSYHFYFSLMFKTYKHEWYLIYC
jgi:hypothetical protein